MASKDGPSLDVFINFVLTACLLAVIGFAMHTIAKRHDSRQRIRAAICREIPKAEWNDTCIDALVYEERNKQ